MWPARFSNPEYYYLQASVVCKKSYFLSLPKSNQFSYLFLKTTNFLIHLPLAH
jgi:hypothetical protein